MHEQVLLVGADASGRKAVALALQRAGLRVTTVASGRDGLRRAGRGDVDLVILDVTPPGSEGFEMCRELRRTSRVPVLALTVRGASGGAADGREPGADDHLRKPFENRELLARARALLRRAGAPPDDHGPLVVGGLEIDPAAHAARRDGRPLRLTTIEFRLLYELVRRPGQVFTRQMLLEQVWNYHYLGNSRLVDVAVQRLRAKLGEDPRDPKLIHTVRGVGYRLWTG